MRTRLLHEKCVVVQGLVMGPFTSNPAQDLAKPSKNNGGQKPPGATTERLQDVNGWVPGNVSRRETTRWRQYAPVESANKEMKTKFTVLVGK